MLIAFSVLLGITWLGFHNFYSTASAGSLASSVDHDYEIISDSTPRNEPTAVAVTDKQGKTRWTISIPHKASFPLLPAQYQEVCKQSEEVSKQLLGTGRFSKKHRGYYAVDPFFMDVKEAEYLDLLPTHDPDEGLATPGEAPPPQNVCDRSLTFVMETSDAGLGNTLLALWMSYGLAMHEKRAFFVDDTRWAYGNYTTFFTPPPNPGCAPPPPHHRIPCPHWASHLVISAATLDSAAAFGTAFIKEFSDVKQGAARKQGPMYNLLYKGYEDLFHLADLGDRNYVTERVGNMKSKAHDDGGVIVGLHIRRGDRHPWEYQYQKDYLPVERYMDEVRQLLIDRFEHDEHEDEEEHRHSHMAAKHGSDRTRVTAPSGLSREKNIKPKSKHASSQTKREEALKPRHGAPGLMASQVFLSSDDPNIFSAQEVSRAHRAQDRIVLASKSALEAEHKKQGLKPHKYLDEIAGWEGGFYRDTFMHLGLQTPRRAPVTGTPSLVRWGNAQTVGEAKDVLQVGAVPEQAMKLRELVGRAYLMDLAVMGQSDAVVCAVSAAGCRVLAVMMGWNNAFETTGLGWRNVDGGFEWKAVVHGGEP